MVEYLLNMDKGSISSIKEKRRSRKTLSSKEVVTVGIVAVI